MRRRRAFLLFWVGLWLLIIQSPAWSILIETVPDKRRVAGFVVSEDATKLVLRIPTAGGKSSEEEFRKSKIRIIFRVDRERLARLTRDNPAAYRGYAEELAEQKADPEALDVALRLYLIAAYLDPPKYGRNCLLAMSAIAASSADARKYRAMALLLDPKSDESLLAPKAGSAAKIPDTAWQTFESALREFRVGNVVVAKERAQEKGVGDCFDAVQGTLDKEQFIQACTEAICPRCHYGGRNTTRCPACSGSGSDVSGTLRCANCQGKGVVKCPVCTGSGIDRKNLERHLEVVIRCELRAIDRRLPNAPAVEDRLATGTWSSAVSNPQLAPVPLLTLETITGYDPRKCVYRNGAWVAP